MAGETNPSASAFSEISDSDRDGSNRDFQVLEGER